MTFKDNRSFRLHSIKEKCSDGAGGGAPAEGGDASAAAVASLGRTYGCHRCDTLFKERSALLRHLLFACKIGADPICVTCDSMFASQEEFSEHRKFCGPRRKRRLDDDDDDRSLVEGVHVICTKCGKMFFGKERYEAHAQRCQDDGDDDDDDYEPTPAAKRTKQMSPEEQKEAYMRSQFRLKPKDAAAGDEDATPGAGTPRTPGSRARRSPRKYADESYEKGWAETTAAGLVRRVNVSAGGVITLSKMGDAADGSEDGDAASPAPSDPTPPPDAATPPQEMEAEPEQPQEMPTEVPTSIEVPIQVSRASSTVAHWLCS